MFVLNIKFLSVFFVLIGIAFCLSGSVTSQGYGEKSSPTKIMSDINVLAFRRPNDPDMTAALDRAIASASMSGGDTEIWLPCGIYEKRGTLSITVSGGQSVHLAGAAASCVRIIQMDDSDGIDAFISNYGSNFLGGSITLSGITMQMAAASSTTRKAISITSNSVTGRTGVPYVLDDITTSSASDKSAWETDLFVSGASNIAYLHRISVDHNGKLGTAIDLEGSQKSYEASIYGSDITVIGGNIALKIGSYTQGIHFQNMNSINTFYSVYSAPKKGINEEIQITGSYLDGHLLLDGTAAPLNSVLIDAYIDSDGLSSGDSHVEIKNVPAFQLRGTLNGPASKVAKVTGLTIEGMNNYGTRGIGLLVQAYGAGGTGILIKQGVRNALFVGTTLINNSTDVIDNGTGTTFAASSLEGSSYLLGWPGSPRSIISQDSVQMDGALGAHTYSADAAQGVSCSGVPTARYTVTKGIVTHC